MEKKATTLSTGVELGAWGYPAGNSLPPLNLTREEILAILETNKDVIDRMIESITCGPRLHQPVSQNILDEVLD